MENTIKYVKLTLGNEELGVEYDYRHFFTSECVTTYSKYLCLSNAGALPAYFKMEIFDNNRCSFQFHDGPYKGQWIHYDGGYLYVTSKYDYLAGDFSANGSSVKPWTNQNGSKHWFKKGSKYKNDYFGDFFYVVTTKNESEGITFGIEDISDRIGVRPPKVQPKKKAYFFKGDQFIAFDIEADRADPGYPRSIRESWPGLKDFSGAIDAIIDVNREKLYFFSGSKYLRYDAATAQFDAEPKPTDGGEWPGLESFASGFDAAVDFDDRKAYFFKGSRYIAYDKRTGRAFEGYPTEISDNWHGVGSFATGIDAAVNLGKGTVYLFKGSQYIRYDVASDRAATGPLPIKGNWAGLEAFADGIDGAIVF
ncbi:hypothetical protein D187_005597 [Cystobacter fuscus DSM 2262]|uniref:Hemopexin n=1 Tax=Cystobacter fuscus (strain ATCC 25194 / DSM 2262 / NBRC 100088 / M29) TaxID=1242864 RepID=S9QM20_CYSF2|nr:hemopexin repeat-containing protein [Cystobacter fuscus]EPX57558.1 hypothetical protein D187_005597 [Cystobacter fuscus DSM 2262]